jgi:hypothetical protein
LTARDDAGTALLERLKLYNPPVFDSGSDINIKTIEILMSQNVFLSMLNLDNKKILVETTLINDYLRQKENETINRSFRGATWLLIGRAMANANYLPFVANVSRDENLKSFLEDRTYTYLEEVYQDIPERIVSYAQDFVSKN